MKKFAQTLGLIVLVVAGSAFTSSVIKKVNVTESTVKWEGKKVTGKHNGTINLSEGYFEMDGDNITGGKFVIDMTSITVTDLSGKGKANLEGHLKSDDFFGVENYPTATLVVTGATKNGNTYTVNGDITIKATTEPISFDLTMNGNSATTTVTIDRSKFDVRYGSGSFFDNLGDKTIYDDFSLEVNLKM